MSNPQNTTIADLQKQMAEMMGVIKEERALRQRAEHEVEELKRGNTTSAAVAPIHSPTVAGRAKVNTPELYDGTVGVAAEAFVMQLGLYTISNPDYFSTDAKKIAFAVSYLTGDAAMWARPYFEAIYADSPVSFDQFFDEFRHVFYDPQKKLKAEAALRSLKQTGSVTQYAHTFNKLAREAGWEVPTLISHFIQGLKSDVQFGIAVSRAEFTTLAEVGNMAIKLGAIAEGRQNQRHGSSKPDPDAMDLSAVNGRLSDPERMRMLKAGQCFKCGRQGHRAKECPDTKGKRTTGTSTRIAELEEAIGKLTADSRKASSSKNGGARD